MAFPTGWTKKCSLTIDNTKVSGSANLTNFPVLLTEANFPSTIFDNTQSAGQDLRFSSDSAGTTELAFEIVNWDTTNDKAEVWVKIPTVDYDDDTVFYVWYGNSSASAYAKDATYGSQAVWADYEGVWHLEGSYNGTSGEVIDSSGQINGTATTAPAQVDGKLTKGQDFDGTDDYIYLGTPTSLWNIDRITLSAWVKIDSGSSGSRYFIGKQSSESGVLGENFALGYNWGANKARFYVHSTSGWHSSGDSTTSVNDGNWHYITGVYDYSYVRIYVDGANESSGAAASKTIGSDCNASMYIGAYETHPANVTASFMQGLMDEVRASATDKSAGWIATEYANQNSPATFVVEGTEESVGGTGCLLGFLGKGIIPSVRNC